MSSIWLNNYKTREWCIGGPFLCFLLLPLIALGATGSTVRNPNSPSNGSLIRPTFSQTTFRQDHHCINPSPFDKLLHEVVMISGSTPRPCPPDQRDPLYTACRSTGIIRCGQTEDERTRAPGRNSAGTAVSINIDNQWRPGYIATAAHVLYQSETGQRRPDCFFYPTYDQNIRISITDSRMHGTRVAWFGLDLSNGDLAVARFGQVQRNSGNQWVSDSERAPLDFTSALPMVLESNPNLASIIEGPNLAQLGYDSQSRRLNYSRGCSLPLHDQELDNPRTSGSWKSSCSALPGWSGGPIVSIRPGQLPRIVCLQTSDTGQSGRTARNFDRDSYFNLCEPFDRSFYETARDFARQ